MGKLIGSIFAVLFALVGLIIAFGPLVSGVWLGILGEWRLIGLGIGYMLMGTFLIGLFILPGIAFVAGAIALQERGSSLAAMLAGIPALVWTYVVALGSCVLVFLYVVDQIPRYDNAIPYLLWATGVAAAPWGYMATKEQESGNGTYSLMTATFLFIGCAVAAVWYYLEGAESWQDWAIRIGTPLLLSLVVQLTLMISEMRSRTRW